MTGKDYSVPNTFSSRTALATAGSSVPIPLTKDMFERAFKKIPPSISAELLETYEQFRSGKE